MEPVSGRVPSEPGSREPSPSVSAASGFDPSREWIAYDERRPDAEGVYEWRVPSRVFPDMITQFCAHMRERGAGYSTVLSPTFDHWDGYRVSVPIGTLWRATSDHGDLKRHDNSPPSIVGHDVAPCRFCGTVHLLEGWTRCLGGGLLVGADPHEYNDWELKTCAWARAPRFKDPRALIAAWNERHSDSDRSPKGEDADAASSETRARAEGIAQGGQP